MRRPPPARRGGASGEQRNEFQSNQWNESLLTDLTLHACRHHRISAVLVIVLQTTAAMSAIPAYDLSLDELSTTLSYVVLGLGSPVAAAPAKKAPKKKEKEAPTKVRFRESCLSFAEKSSESTMSRVSPLFAETDGAKEFLYKKMPS